VATLASSDAAALLTPANSDDSMGNGDGDNEPWLII
jgi:hypothetical protein